MKANVDPSHAISELVELHFLDAVSHPPASAIEFFIEITLLEFLGTERGNDKTRVGTFGKMLSLGNHATSSAPCLLSSIAKILEDTRCMVTAVANSDGLYGFGIVVETASNDHTRAAGDLTCAKAI